MNDNKNKYLTLTKNHTEKEIAEKLNLSERTIRRYAQQTGVKPKTNKFKNRTTNDWFNLFNKTFNPKLTVKNVNIDTNGKTTGLVTCNQCDTEWIARLPDKIKNKTGCISCDSGNYGNKYSEKEVLLSLNDQYKDQWQLIHYGRYSQKESIIRCTLCGFEHKVNLSDVINTTSKRCTNCQTGSFGEYVIRHVLRYNNIPYETEVPVHVNHKNYRLDFLIDNHIALEYSGLQHFKEGLYFNQDITDGVAIKAEWSKQKGYDFHEIIAKKTMNEIINDLSMVLKRPLIKPTPEFFAKSDENMVEVLNYMRHHSARKTSKDLKVPMSKIKKYIQINGYSSISAWQAENKNDIE